MCIYKSPNLNQVSYGESIGIILLKTVTPAIPGDVANALSYSFPVRYKVIEEANIETMFTKPEKILNQFIKAARELKEEGVKAITGDCGFMAALQTEIANSVDIPVFMSSLLQIPFIIRLISKKQKIGVITASSISLSKKYFEGMGINPGVKDRLVLGGMENEKHFKETFLDEKEYFNKELLENEVVNLAKKMKSNNKLGAFLIECSVLPPYSTSVQEKTGLPVFDFITMINYVQSAVVRSPGTFYGI